MPPSERAHLSKKKVKASFVALQEFDLINPFVALGCFLIVEISRFLNQMMQPLTQNEKRIKLVVIFFNRSPL